MDNIGRTIGGIIRRNANQVSRTPRSGSGTITRTPRVPSPPPLVPSSPANLGAAVARNIPAPASPAFNVGQVAANIVRQNPVSPVPEPEPRFNMPSAPILGASLNRTLGNIAMPQVGPGLAVGSANTFTLGQSSGSGITRSAYQDDSEWGVYDVNGVNVAMPTYIAELNDLPLVSASTTTDPDEVATLSGNHIAYTNMPDDVIGHLTLPKDGSPFGEAINAQAAKLKQESLALNQPEKVEALTQFAENATISGLKQASTVANPSFLAEKAYVLVSNNNPDVDDRMILTRQEWEDAPEIVKSQYTVVTDRINEDEYQSILASGVVNEYGEFPDAMNPSNNVQVRDSTRETADIDEKYAADAVRYAAEYRLRLGADITVVDGKEYPTGYEPKKITVGSQDLNNVDELPPAPDGYVWVADLPPWAVNIMGTTDALNPFGNLFNFTPTPYLVPLTRNREGEIVVGSNQTILNHPDGKQQLSVHNDDVATVVGIPAQGINWVFSDGIGSLFSWIDSGAGSLIPDSWKRNYDKWVREPASRWIEKNIPEGVPRDTALALIDNPIMGVLVVAGSGQEGTVKNLTLVTLYPDDTGVVRDGGAGIFRNMPGVNWYIDWMESDPDTARYIFENGYDSDGDGQVDLYGHQAVQEYWHLEVLSQDPWGESKWFIFSISSDPTAYFGAGAVGGKLIRNQGTRLRLAPNATKAKVLTGRGIELTGEGIYRGARIGEGVADLGLEYVARFSADMLRKATITKEVDSEVRNQKSSAVGNVSASVIQRDVTGQTPANVMRSMMPPPNTPTALGPTPTPRVPGTPPTNTSSGTPPTNTSSGTPPTNTSSGTPPPAARSGSGRSRTIQTPKNTVTIDAGGNITFDTPATVPPVVDAAPGPSVTDVIYGPSLPLSPAPGTTLHQRANAGKWQVWDTSTDAPVRGGSRATYDTPEAAMSDVDPTFESVPNSAPNRWTKRGEYNVDAPYKIDRLSWAEYRQLHARMAGQWSDSVVRLRELGSGTPTIAHNNESHRIALLTDAAIMEINPALNQPWEYNRYKTAPIPHANESIVRLPWHMTAQERSFLLGNGSMDWGDNVVAPSGQHLMVGPVKANPTELEIVAYNNAVDTTYYHVKWQGETAFLDQDFFAWFLDAVRTDVDLRSRNLRTPGPYTPPPLWEMSEIPAADRPQVATVVQQAEAALVDATARTDRGTIIDAPADPVPADPDPGKWLLKRTDAQDVGTGGDIPNPPPGTTPRQPGTIAPVIPAALEPPAPEPVVANPDNGVYDITTEVVDDEFPPYEITRYDFLEDGSVYAKTESYAYRDVPAPWRRRYPEQRGTSWVGGVVTKGQRYIDVFAPNEAEFINVAIALSKAEGFLPESHPGGVSTGSTKSIEIDATAVYEFKPGLKENGKMGSKIKAIPAIKEVGGTIQWNPDRGGPIILERMSVEGKRFYAAHTAAGDIYFHGTGRNGFKIIDTVQPVLNGKFQTIPYRVTLGTGQVVSRSTGMDPDFMVNYIYTQHVNAADAAAPPPAPGVLDAEPVVDTPTPDTVTETPPPSDVPVDQPALESDAPPVEQPTPDGSDLATEPAPVQTVDVPEPAVPEVADVPRETGAADTEPGLPRARSSRPRSRNRVVSRGRRRPGFQRSRQAVVETLTPDERNADLPAGWSRAEDTRMAPSADISTMPEVFQPRSSMNEDTVINMSENWDPSRQEPIDVTVVDGNHIVFSGHHRLEAAQRRTNVLGIPTDVRVRVHDWGDRTTNIHNAQELADFANISRTTQSPADNAGVVRRARDRGQSYEEIQGKMGTISRAEVERLDKVNDLPPALFQALSDNWTYDGGGRVKDSNLLTVRKGAAIVDEIAAGHLTNAEAWQFYIDNIVNTPMTDADFTRWLNTHNELMTAVGLFDVSEFGGIDMSGKAVLAQISKDAAKETKSLTAQRNALTKSSKVDELSDTSRTETSTLAKDIDKQIKDQNAAMIRAGKKLVDDYKEAQRTGVVQTGSGGQRMMDMGQTQSPAPEPTLTDQSAGVARTDAGRQNMMDLGAASRPVFGQMQPGGIVDADDLLQQPEVPADQRMRDSGMPSLFDLDEPSAPPTAAGVIDAEVDAKAAAIDRAQNGNVHISPTIVDIPPVQKTGETTMDPTGTIEIPVWEETADTPAARYGIQDKALEGSVKKLVADIESNSTTNAEQRIGNLRVKAERRLRDRYPDMDRQAIDDYVSEVLQPARDAYDPPEPVSDVGRPSKPYPLSRDADGPFQRLRSELRREGFGFVPDAAVYSTALDSFITSLRMGPNQGALTAGWKKYLEDFHEWVRDGRPAYNIFDEDAAPLSKDPVPAESSSPAPDVVDAPADATVPPVPEPVTLRPEAIEQISRGKAPKQTMKQKRMVKRLETTDADAYATARTEAVAEIERLDAEIESAIASGVDSPEASTKARAAVEYRGELASLIEEGDLRHSASGLSAPGEKIVNDIFDDPNVTFVTIPGGVTMSRLATKASAKIKNKMVVDTLHAQRTHLVQDTQGNQTWMGHPILEEEIHILTEVPFADGSTVFSRVEAEYLARGTKDKWKSDVRVYEQLALREVLGEYETRLLEVYPDGVLPNFVKAGIRKLPKWVQDRLESAAKVLRNIVGGRDWYLGYRRQRMLLRRDRMITYPANQFVGNTFMAAIAGKPRTMLDMWNYGGAWVPVRQVQEGVTPAQIRNAQARGKRSAMVASSLPQPWEHQLIATPAQQMNARLGVRGAAETFDVYKGRQLGDAETSLIGERTLRKLPGASGDFAAWLWGSNKGGSKTVLRAARGDIVFRDSLEVRTMQAHMKTKVIPDYRNQTINYLVDHANMDKSAATRLWNRFMDQNRHWEFSYNDVNNFFKQHATSGQAERLARNWQQAVNQSQKYVSAEIRRVGFASPTTRADLVLQRVMMFHYFQTRQTWFLAQQALKHPFLLNLYATAYEELQNASEGWPSYLKGWVKLLGDGAFGRAIFFNPVALLSTYLMFNDRGTIWEEGKERPTNPGDLKWWMDTIGFSPDINDALNVTGYMGDSWAPDIFGIRAESNILTMALNWGRAHGYIGDDPRPIGDYYNDSMVRVRSWASGFFQEEPIPARTSESTYDAEITAIGYDEARKDGLNPENAHDKNVIDSMMADPDSDLYRRSVKRWVNGEAAEIGIKFFAQPFRPLFRQTNTEGEDLMTNLSDEEKWAVNTADPRVTLFRNQQTGWYRIGSAQDQALLDSWSDIANGTVVGDITVNGVTYTEDQINNQFTYEQRKAIADGHLAELGVLDDVNVVRDERAKYIAQPENAEYATYKRWQKAVYDYEGGPEAYWEALRKENPAAQYYWENTIMQAESDEERERLMTGNNAYFGLLGYHVSRWDAPPPGFDSRQEVWDPVNIANQAPTPTPYTEPNAEYRQEVRTMPVFASEMKAWDDATIAKRQELGMDTTTPFSQLSYPQRKQVEDALADDGIYEPKPTWQQREYLEWAEKKLAQNPNADVSIEKYFEEDQQQYYENLPAQTEEKVNAPAPAPSPDVYGNPGTTTVPAGDTGSSQFWIDLINILDEHDHERYKD